MLVHGPPPLSSDTDPRRRRSPCSDASYATDEPSTTCECRARVAPLPGGAPLWWREGTQLANEKMTKGSHGVPGLLVGWLWGNGPGNTTDLLDCASLGPTCTAPMSDAIPRSPFAASSAIRRGHR